MPSQKKQDAVSRLIDLLKSNPNFALVKFENTPHLVLETLRKELKKNSAGMKVVKNSLFQKATFKLSKEEKLLKDIAKEVFPLRENSAFVYFNEDYQKGLSIFFKFAKKDPSLNFKFGIIDKKLYLEEELTKIAELPGKEELIAKLIGSLKSPSSKFVYSLKFTQSKLVYILSEKSKQTS